MIILGATGFGCTALGEWTSAQARCAGDPNCMEETKNYAKIGQTVAGFFGATAGAGAGAAVAFVALGVLGLKKKEEKK